MNPYWIEPQKVCVEAQTESEAKAIAEQLTGLRVELIKILPYPGGKRIGEISKCPSFCYSPEVCAGYHSCPKSYACSE
jgi:hypothetical protein